MKIKFRACRVTGFVHGVTSVAAHVECSVSAASFRNIRPLRVASQAEIVLLIARRSGFNNWFLLSDVCGSWQVRQIANRGGWTRPLICVESLSLWQVRQSL